MYSCSQTIFNFHWNIRNTDDSYSMTRLSAVSSVGFLRDVFEGRAFDVRNAPRSFVGHNLVQLFKYVVSDNHPKFGMWTIGSSGEVTFNEMVTGKDGKRTISLAHDNGTPGPSSSTAAGWHCSWCLPVDDIRIKMLSAQSGDLPRWGDFPEKCDPIYIRRLVSCGLWFDERLSLDRVVAPFVPRAVLENQQRYGYLLPQLVEKYSNISCPGKTVQVKLPR